MPEVINTAGLDTTGKLRPALSATSDMPNVGQLAQAEETPVEPPKEESKTEPAPEPKPEEPKTEEPKVEAKTEPPAPDDEIETSDGKKVSYKDLPPWVKREMTIARNQKRAAEAARKQAEDERAAALQALANMRPEPKAEPPKPAPERPKRDAFDSPEDYDSALIDWAAKTAAGEAEAKIAADKKKADDEAVQARQTEENNRRHQAWMARVEKAYAEKPDFVEVTQNQNLRITNEMAYAIVDAENGTDVAYWLGKNPEEALRISAMSPFGQAVAIGRIAERLANPLAPRVQVSKAPEPIKPLRSTSAALPKSPDEETMDEYAARRGREIAAQRRPFAQTAGRA